MARKMKKILKISGIMVATAILIGVGYWAGTASSFFRHMWVGSAVSQSATKAAVLSMRVGQINEGKIDELKSHLNLELDGEILTLASLMDWENPNENVTTGIKVLRRIAEWRNTWSYTNDNPVIQSKLMGIYDKVVAYQQNEP